MRFSSLFHDHAVLQRDAPLPVWGRCAPHEEVTVTLGGLTARTLSGGEGRWLVRFPPSPAGGPHELAASAASGRAVARDILFGEVWLASGQSNMEWPLSKVDPPDVEGPAPALPAIRLLTVENPPRLGRHEEVVGRWRVATPETFAAFSAVAGWFGRELHRELGVPVGLICCAVGGTRIEAWIGREALVGDPDGAGEVRRFEAQAYAPLSDVAALAPASGFEEWDKGNRGLAEGWAEPGYDAGRWPSMPVPGRWQDHGHPSNGVVWFRREATVPAGWAGRDLELRLGRIDKHDDTWVNGERVGGLSWNDGPDAWRTPRRYPVPARLIGADRRLHIAVRVRSHIYHGGLIGPADMMRLAPRGGAGEAPLFLAGAWRYRVEQDWGVVDIPAERLGVDTPNAPGILFDSRIAPLLPFALRGAIWYQGEANASQAAAYRRLLPLMVRDWRRAWGQGDFAFLQVQLAGHGPAYDQPAGSEWAELREAQAGALSEPNTGLAVAIDIGDALDIHPRHKDEVGRRLARWALSRTYGRGGAPAGPLYDGIASRAGGEVRIAFRYAAGLRTRDGGAPGAVAVAGPDRTFVWAESRIEGESLVVRHPAIAVPVAVRYAWADYPVGCNLVNGEGLPAAPFRTDRW